MGQLTNKGKLTKEDRYNSYNFMLRYGSRASLCYRLLTLWAAAGVWTYCFIDCLAVGGARLLIRNGGILDAYFNDRHESATAAEGWSFELLIPVDSDIRLNGLLESQLCLQVNGYTCYCFPSSYRDVKVTIIPRQCLPKHKNWTMLWFSIQLRFDAIDDPSQNEALFDVRESSTNTRTINSLAVLVRNEHHPQIDHCAASDGNKVNTGPTLLSLVLLLATDDLSRSLILLNSLKLVPTDTVLELLIFVPDDHLPLLKKPIDGMMASGFNFSTSVHSEQVLFRRPFAEYTNTAYPYALQMAIKLLAAQLVRTPFYITLDADVMLLHPFTTDMLLSEHSQDMPFTSFTFDDDGIHAQPQTISSPLEGRSATHYRAAYHYEDRSVHPNWWSGSEALLGVGPTQEGGRQVGFGVTPAVLSTFGSLSTVAMICSSLEEYAMEFNGGELQTTAACEERWLDGLGVSGSRSGLWSEYTAYRLALQHLEVSSFAAVAHNSSASLHTTPICSCSSCCTWTRYRWANHMSSCIATTSGTLISCHGPRKKLCPTRAACSRWSSPAQVCHRGLSTDSTFPTVLLLLLPRVAEYSIVIAKKSQADCSVHPTRETEPPKLHLQHRSHFHSKAARFCASLIHVDTTNIQQHTQYTL